MATKAKPVVKAAPARQEQPQRQVQSHNQREKEEIEMAKPPAKVVTQEVATTDMDAELLHRMKTDKGGGLSKDAADNLVPLIYLLQPLSPQVMKGDPARIDGAEAGDIWLRNAEDPIVKGEEGMVFQPCGFWKDIVEWIPNRGGFVGRHDISCLPNVTLNKRWTGSLSDVQEIQDEDDPNAWPRYIRSSNNNEVVETRYFAGNVYFDDGRLPLPFIIPLSSTGHSFGKQWMFLQNSQTLPDGTPNDKSWVFLYRLKTTMKTNAKGSWYTYTVTKERAVKNMAEYDRGQALHNAFASGDKKIDDEMMDAARGGAAQGDLNNEEM
jgi:hypothetical protein